MANDVFHLPATGSTAAVNNDEIPGKSKNNCGTMLFMQH